MTQARWSVGTLNSSSYQEVPPTQLSVSGDYALGVVSGLALVMIAHAIWRAGYRYAVKLKKLGVDIESYEPEPLIFRRRPSVETSDTHADTSRDS